MGAAGLLLGCIIGGLALTRARCPPAGPRGSDEASGRASGVSGPLEIEWSGCAEVRLRAELPVCEPGSGRSLRLWMHEPLADGLEIAIDGEPVEATRYTVDGEPGEGWRLILPDGAAEVTVQRAAGGSGEVLWSLVLGSASSEPSDALRRAHADIGAALRRGDGEAARWAAQRAFDVALAEGRLSQAVDAMLVVAVELSRRNLDAALAAELLRHVEPAARRYPKGRGDLAAYRGLHRWYEGAMQDAAESLRDAARYAVRLEDPELSADSLPMYAETLAELGYFDDARRWAREGLRIVRGRRPACELGSALRTVGWVNLRLQQRGRSHDDPAPFFDEALEIFGPRGACPRPAKRGGAFVSLALLALDEGRLDVGRAQLEQIDRAVLTLDERVLADDVDVRLSLAEDRGARPRAAFERLRRSVAMAGTADARWREHTRSGQLLEREGRPEAAIEAYRRAEAELDALVRLQAVGIGRGERADRYHQSTEALVSLLVEQGDIDEAWCVERLDQARRRAAAVAPSALGPARSSELREMIRRYRRHKLAADSLDARAHRLPRDEMRLARRSAAEAAEQARALANELSKALGSLAPRPRCAELSPPSADELLLGIYPRDHDWLLFAGDHAHAAVHVVPAPRPEDSPERLARTLLTPVGAQLEAVSRIRVLAHHGAQRVDVHRLPWRGAPLGTQWPVSYGVELPASAAPRSSASRERRALLIADPTGTLERARDEVVAARAGLRAAGWATSVVIVDDAQPPGAVSLAGYDLVHYAGHAEAGVHLDRGGWPPYEAGVAGWAAFLELGRGGRLTVHDVITMSSAPRLAVLAGCRTGMLELDTGQTSMALAFLVAGSEQVVASAEAVDDEQGLRFAQGLYDAIDRDPEVDLALAMQRVQLEVWTSAQALPNYRVWVR